MHIDRMRICGDCESPLLPFRWKESGRSCECALPSCILKADRETWGLFEFARQPPNPFAGGYAPVGSVVLSSYWQKYDVVLEHHGDGTVSVASLLVGPDGGLDRIRRHRTPTDRRDVIALGGR